MKYRGHVKGGVVVLDTPTSLPEGAAVEITPVKIPLDIEGQPIDPAFLIGDLAIDMGKSDLGSMVRGGANDHHGTGVGEEAENSLLRMLRLAGPTGIPDLATNHDHYLYGHPKVDDE